VEKKIIPQITKPKMVDLDLEAEAENIEATTTTKKKKTSKKAKATTPPDSEAKNMVEISGEEEETETPKPKKASKKRKAADLPPPDSEDEEKHEDEEEEEEEEEHEEEDEDKPKKKRKSSKAPKREVPLPAELQEVPPGPARPVRAENSVKSAFERMWNTNEKGIARTPEDPLYYPLSKLRAEYKKKGDADGFKNDPKYVKASEKFTEVNNTWKKDIENWKKLYPVLAKYTADVKNFRRKDTLAIKKNERIAKDKEYEVMKKQLESIHNGEMPTAIVPMTSSKRVKMTASSSRQMVPSGGGGQVDFQTVERMFELESVLSQRIKETFRDYLLSSAH
jgi:hypothetical protein